ncbi:hypothetical protein JCM10450v2_000021 [Rhodotorula kratochvilovae]
MLVSTLLALASAALALASTDGAHSGSGNVAVKEGLGDKDAPFSFGDWGDSFGGFQSVFDSGTDKGKCGVDDKGSDSDANGGDKDSHSGDKGGDKGSDSSKGNDVGLDDVWNFFEAFSQGFQGKEGPDGHGGEWTRRIVKARP